MLRVGNAASGGLPQAALDCGTIPRSVLSSDVAVC